MSRAQRQSCTSHVPPLLLSHFMKPPSRLFVNITDKRRSNKIVYFPFFIPLSFCAVAADAFRLSALCWIGAIQRFCSSPPSQLFADACASSRTTSTVTTTFCAFLLIQKVVVPNLPPPPPPPLLLLLLQ